MSAPLRQIALLLLLSVALPPGTAAAGAYDAELAPVTEIWSDFDSAGYERMVLAYGGNVTDKRALSAELAAGLSKRKWDLSAKGALLNAWVYWVAADFLAARDRWAAAGKGSILGPEELAAFRDLPRWLLSGAVAVGLHPGPGAGGPEYLHATDQLLLPQEVLGADLGGSLLGMTPPHFGGLLVHELLHAVQDQRRQDTSSARDEVLAALFEWQARVVQGDRQGFDAWRAGLKEGSERSQAALAKPPDADENRLERAWRLFMLVSEQRGLERRLQQAIADRAVRLLDEGSPLPAAAPKLEPLFVRWRAHMELFFTASQGSAGASLDAQKRMLQPLHDDLVGRGLEIARYIEPTDPRLQLAEVARGYGLSESQGAYVVVIGFQLQWMALTASEDAYRAFLDDVVFGPALDVLQAAGAAKPSDVDGIAKAS